MSRSKQMRRLTGRCLPLFLLVLGMAGRGSLAQAPQTVYVPLSFHTESEVLLTSACLEVSEQVTGLAADGTGGSIGLAQTPLGAVMAAIKRKDRDALFQLSDPVFGRDPKQFDMQAQAYFQQFEKFEVLGISRIYELDGLTVYLTRLKTGQTTVSAPFLFTTKENNQPGFLPYQTDLVSYKLLQDWIFAKWGPAKTDSPSYCDASTVAHATHRVALGPAASQGKHPSRLFLAGAPVADPAAFRSTVIQVQAAFKTLDESLATEEMQNLYSMLPAATGKRVRATLTASTPEERDKFKQVISQQQPFFVFDLSSLLVVYTKSPTGDVQVMYFTYDAQHKLIWTNAYLVTAADKVFKRGLLYEASQAKIPFSTVVLR